MGNARLLRRITGHRLRSSTEVPALERGVAVADDPLVSVGIDQDGRRALRRDGPADVGWSLFADAEVRAAEPLVWLERDVVSEPTWRASDITLPLGRGIRRRGDRLLQRGIPSSTVLEGGRFLTGHYSHGWAHWLLDVLPKLVIDAGLPTHLRAVPLLVPEHALDHPRFRESLATFVDPEEAVRLEMQRMTRLSRLVWLDGPRPYLTYAGDKASSSHEGTIGLREHLMGRYRDAVRAVHASGVRPDPRRRILLVRGAGAKDRPKRRHNDAELLAVARREGFEAVELETLAFADQVGLVASAGVIAGPHGAAWSGVLFAGTGTRGLIVRSSASAGSWLYPTLAHLAGLELHALDFAEPVAPATTGHVDPDRFREALRALLERT